MSSRLYLFFVFASALVVTSAIYAQPRQAPLPNEKNVATKKATSVADAVAGMLISEYCRARYQVANMLLGNSEPAMGRYMFDHGSHITYYYRLETSPIGHYCGAIYRKKSPGGAGAKLDISSDCDSAFVNMLAEVKVLAIELLGRDYIPLVGETSDKVNEVLTKSTPVNGVDTFSMIVESYEERLADIAASASNSDSAALNEPMITEYLPQLASPDYQISVDFVDNYRLAQEIALDVERGVLALQSSLSHVLPLADAEKLLPE